jgi:hypothetical protein
MSVENPLWGAPRIHGEPGPPIAPKAGVEALGSGKIFLDWF